MQSLELRNPRELRNLSTFRVMFEQKLWPEVNSRKIIFNAMQMAVIAMDNDDYEFQITHINQPKAEAH